MIDLSFLNRDFYGEPLSDFCWFAGIIVGTLLIKRPVAALLTHLLGRLAYRFSYANHKKDINDMIVVPLERLLLIVLFYIAFNQISDTLDKFVVYHSMSKQGKLVIKLGDLTEHIFLLFFIVFLALLVVQVINIVSHIQIRRAHDEKNFSRMQLLPLLKELSKLGTWLFCIFWILGSVFNVNIPALITGLGIGGVAIALAGKETVENVFAAFTILSDRPFQVGEWVRVADIEGIVEQIGFRSTRIRRIDGSEIIMANQKLVSQNVVNLTNRNQQVIKMGFPIHYESDTHAIEFIVQEIGKLLAANQLIVGPPDIIVDMQRTDAIYIRVELKFPYPLPEGIDLVTEKRKIIFAIHSTIFSKALMGGTLKGE